METIRRRFEIESHVSFLGGNQTTNSIQVVILGENQITNFIPGGNDIANITLKVPTTLSRSPISRTTYLETNSFSGYTPLIWTSKVSRSICS
jgi:hypothetical protein